MTLSILLFFFVVMAIFILALGIAIFQASTQANQNAHHQPEGRDTATPPPLPANGLDRELGNALSQNRTERLYTLFNGRQEGEPSISSTRVSRANSVDSWTKSHFQDNQGPNQSGNSCVFSVGTA